MITTVSLEIGLIAKIIAAVSIVAFYSAVVLKSRDDLRIGLLDVSSRKLQGARAVWFAVFLVAGSLSSAWLLHDARIPIYKIQHQPFCLVQPPQPIFNSHAGCQNIIWSYDRGSNISTPVGRNSTTGL